MGAYACDANRPLADEDDGVRCRMSGICDDDAYSPKCSETSIDIMRDFWLRCEDPASARDNELACIRNPTDRANRVREAIAWTWKSYLACAPGMDEVKPLSCTHSHWLNLTLTAVDGLDTLLLAGLEQEFQEAITIVLNNFYTQTSGDCNLFETTIRILGGLLSTYHIIDDNENKTSKFLLEYATDLGSRLIHGFDCYGNKCSGIPFSDVNLGTGSTDGSVPFSSLSEISTLSLEFTSLARLTGQEHFEMAALKVHDALYESVKKYDGILPQYFSPYINEEPEGSSYFMLGARTDSYYEYLLKQWILTGCQDDMLLDRFKQAMKSIRSRLIRRTEDGESSRGVLYVGEEVAGKLVPKMDHLVCFLPGVLALADYYNVSTTDRSNDISDLELSKELVSTCYKMYQQTPSGLAAEIVHFIDEDLESSFSYPGGHPPDVGGGHFYVKDSDSHSLLRPETVESLYILWKVTGDPIYREWSWSIFRAFQKWTRVERAEHCSFLSPSANILEFFLSRMASIIQEIGDSIKEGSDISIDWKTIQEVLDDYLKELGKVSRTGNNATDPEFLRDILDLSSEIAILATLDGYSNSKLLNQNTGKEFSMGNKKLQPILDQIACRMNDLQERYRARCMGYSNLRNVLKVPPVRMDKTESFWLSETLKYLYLIFYEHPDRCLHDSCIQLDSPSAIGEQIKLSLDKWVFNTEAHPLPIVGPNDLSIIQPVSWLNSELLRPYGHKEFQFGNRSAGNNSDRQCQTNDIIIE